jgi:hypothetical protein
MKQIIVTVKGKSVEVETTGFTGPMCLTESQFLKEALGEIVTTDLKATFYEGNSVKEEQTVKRTLKPLCG